MKAIFDASVLVTMLVGDRGWPEVQRWLHQNRPDSLYSDFCLGEVYSAIGNRVRRGDMTADYARDLIAASRDYLQHWTVVSIVASDIADATAMLANFALGLRLPDAIHLATARRLGLTLVSSDIAQVRAARTLGIATTNPTLLEDLS